MQSSKQKRFLEVPGEDIFIGTFEFKMEPPILPIPYAKTVVYPLDGERYTKPVLTSFFFKNTNKLLAPVDLGVQVDHINMSSDVYNTSVGNLHPQEALLLSDHQPLPNPKSPKTTNNPNKNLQESIKTHNNHIQEQYNLENNLSNQPTQFTFEKLTELVNQSFVKAQQIKEGFQHPIRNLKAKKVYSVLPNFDQIEKKFTQISGIELLNITNEKQFILQKTQDTDTQQILKYYKMEDDQESGSQQINFRHNCNIIYNEIDFNVGKLKKYDYLIQFNGKNQNSVSITKIKDNFVLRKKKFTKNELEFSNLNNYQDQIKVNKIQVDKQEIFNKKQILQQISYPVSKEIERLYNHFKQTDKQIIKSPLVSFKKQEQLEEEEWQYDVNQKNQLDTNQNNKSSHQPLIQQNKIMSDQEMNEDIDEELDLDFDDEFDEEFDEDDLNN